MLDIPRNKKTDNQFTASLGTNASFMGYLGHYERAFEALMEYVHISGHSVDRLAYPILFIARHCLELGFKTNIRYFAKYSGREDHTKSGSHDLSVLFNAFKLHVQGTIDTIQTRGGVPVDEVIIAQYKNYCKQVEKLTTVFQLLDKQSDGFRYPVNKQNQPHFNFAETVNLLDVKELLDECMVLLVYTASVLSDYTNALDAQDDDLRDHYNDSLR